MVSLPDRNLSRAVLIGTSKFDRLQDLPAVRNNLSDLRAALTDPDHGILAPENCEVVVNPDSPATFMNRLQQTVNRTNDFLLVYYAGHGVRHDTRDELFLTLPHTDVDSLYGTAIEFRWVRETLEHSPARARLLLLDCCYSGLAVGRMSVADTRDIQVSGAAVLASSPRNRTSHSPVGHRHTAFTGKVINLLRNGSPVAGEPLTVRTLYDRVSVALVSEQYPKPTLKTIDTSGDLLVRRPEKPTPPPDPPTMRGLVPQPAAPSPMAAPLPAHAEPSALALAKMGLLAVLWVVTGIALALTVGGFLGLAFGTSSESDLGDDVTYLIAGGVVVAIIAIPLLQARQSWHSELRAFDPPLTRSVLGRVVLWLGAAVFLSLAVTYLINRDPAGTAGSEVMNRSSLAVAMAEVAFWCGYSLFRWYRAPGRTPTWIRPRRLRAR